MRLGHLSCGAKFGTMLRATSPLLFVLTLTSSFLSCLFSTLWILGMKEEFWEARDWVRDHLDFGAVKGGVSVFETTIR